MAKLYSARFIKATGVLSPFYTVAPGVLIVIRQLTWVGTVDNGECTAEFELPPGEVFVRGRILAANGFYFQWQGRIVLYAGESFGMKLSDPGAMTAHGYVLTPP